MCKTITVVHRCTHHTSTFHPCRYQKSGSEVYLRSTVHRCGVMYTIPVRRLLRRCTVKSCVICEPALYKGGKYAASAVNRCDGVYARPMACRRIGWVVREAMKGSSTA